MSKLVASVGEDERFARLHDLSLEVISLKKAWTSIHGALKDLRHVQQTAQEHRSKWLHEQAHALAAQMNTDPTVALQQIALENATKAMF